MLDTTMIIMTKVLIADLLLQVGAGCSSYSFSKIAMKRTAVLIRNKGDFLSSISSIVAFIFLNSYVRFLILVFDFLFKTLLL